MKSPEEKVGEIWEVADKICNEWEYGFMENIVGVVSEGKTLSEGRLIIIDRLFEKACKSPY